MAWIPSSDLRWKGRPSLQRKHTWSNVPFVVLALFPVCLLALRVDEQRLMDAILQDYNTAARPVYNASQTVTVKFGLTLTQISDMVSVSSVSPLPLCLVIRAFLFSFFLGGRGPDSGMGRKRRHWSEKEHDIPDEQRLLTALLKDYHMYSRPVYNASEKVVIKFGLTLVQISDMVRRTLVQICADLRHDKTGTCADLRHGKTGPYADLRHGKIGICADLRHGKTGPYADLRHGKTGTYADVRHGKISTCADLLHGKTYLCGSTTR